jgi:tetratricopeptide (TPR) repeat protein
MTPEETQILIDRFDESLSGNRASMQFPEENTEAAQEWRYLHLAVDAIREAGLYNQVATVRTAWKGGQERVPVVPVVVPVMETSKPTGGVVRSLYRKYSLRAAAIMLILCSSAFLYKYLSVSSNSLYDRYYSGYELNTSRGAADVGPIEKAYDAKDWSGVLSLAATAKSKDNQVYFLAGMADLELKRYDDAITHFEEIIAVNSHAGTDFYQDEAEYYLAISWLARGQVNEAMPILEKIRANVHHQYHEKVAKMSFFDLRLVQYKENK